MAMSLQMEYGEEERLNPKPQTQSPVVNPQLLTPFPSPGGCILGNGNVPPNGVRGGGPPKRQILNQLPELESVNSKP